MGRLIKTVTLLILFGAINKVRSCLKTMPNINFSSKLIFIGLFLNSNITYIGSLIAINWFNYKMSSVADSAIAQFFSGKRIFLTGATGFVGKVLIEKLLHVCYDLDRIYILVRSKNGKTTEDRFTEIFDYPCFDRVKTERDDYRSKIRLISGDCAEPNLGISKEDREVLINETDIVIHAAAIVKFDQDLRVTANINVRSVIDIIALVKNMPNLKAFIHISTAYSFCPMKDIDEVFYKEPISAQKLLNILDAVDDTTLDQITPILLGKWPNTYVYTKAIAESLIRDEMRDLPCAMVRPGIISCSVKEPIPGWIDNFYGIVGVVVAACLGVLQTFYVDPQYPAQIVPVDYVANNVLAATWDVATEKKTEIPIYNYTGWNDNQTTWAKIREYIFDTQWVYSSTRSVWYQRCTFRKNYLWHRVCQFFLQSVPAHIVDFIFIVIGKPPIAVKGLNRLNQSLSHIGYFSTQTWRFHYKNVEKLWNKLSDVDKEYFDFSMKNLDWKQWISDSVKGGRIYLLKEPLETIPQGIRKLKILFVVHYTFLTVLGLLFLYFLNCVLGLFY